MTSKHLLEAYESGLMPADIVPTVSSTALSRLMNSKQTYHDEYVEGIRSLQTMDMVFGKRIHSMINTFYGKIFASSDSFVKAWSSDWYRTETDDLDIVIPEGTTRAHEFRKRYGKGTNILSSFYSRHIRERMALERRRHDVLESDGSVHLKGKKKKERLKELEIIAANGLFPISELYTGSAEFNGFKLNGFIDRVDTVEDSFVIIDYKTGDINVDGNQLVFYYIATEQLLGKPPAACFLYDLGNGKLVPKIVTYNDVQRLRETLDECRATLTLVEWLRDLRREERGLNGKIANRQEKADNDIQTGLFSADPAVSQMSAELQKTRDSISAVKSYLSLDNLPDQKIIQELPTEPIPNSVYEIRDRLIASWGEPMDRIPYNEPETEIDIDMD
ncbi:MAG: PD-(D/E)XK nuclease family protein [Nanoarchaeota archaeon]